MENQTEQEQEIKSREPKASDIGTRYEHLMEYKESLETCVGLLEKRGSTIISKERIGKLNTAIEILSATLDAFSGYKDQSTEFRLYKLINTVPAGKEGIIELGGTPLNE